MVQNLFPFKGTFRLLNSVLIAGGFCGWRYTPADGIVIM